MFWAKKSLNNTHFLLWFNHLVSLVRILKRVYTQMGNRTFLAGEACSHTTSTGLSGLLGPFLLPQVTSYHWLKSSWYSWYWKHRWCEKATQIDCLNEPSRECSFRSTRCQRAQGRNDVWGDGKWGEESAAKFLPSTTFTSVTVPKT